MNNIKRKIKCIIIIFILIFKKKTVETYFIMLFRISQDLELLSLVYRLEHVLISLLQTNKIFTECTDFTHFLYVMHKNNKTDPHFLPLKILCLLHNFSDLRFKIAFVFLQQIINLWYPYGSA
jgi:ribosomal protein L33